MGTTIKLSLLRGGDQCWSGIIFFFDTIWVSMMRILLILIPPGYEYLTVFLCQFHSGLYTMQEPSYIGKITLVSVWFRIVPTQIMI